MATKPNNTPKQRTYPVSPTQEGLWFINQIAPHNSAYNVIGGVLIKSHVDVQAIADTFRFLMENHTVLRTNFTESNNNRVQVVHENVQPDFIVKDCHAYDDHAILSLIDHDNKKPFNLENDRLLRIKLYSKASNRHYLVVCAHHIIVDFWSLAIILESFKSYYPAFLKSLKIDEKFEDFSFQEFVQEQISLIHNEQNKAWEFWKKNLQNNLSPIHLPLDNKRPKVQRYEGKVIPFQISRTLSDKLNTLAENQEVSLFMLIMAAYQVFISKYSGDEVVKIATPSAGRLQKKYHNAIGNFVNTIVICSNVYGTQSFNKFLRTIRNTILESLRHQHFPFPELVKRLQPERDPSRNPIAQVAFTWERIPQLKTLGSLYSSGENGVDVSFGELLAEPVSLPQQEGQYELNLEMGGTDSQGRLFGFFKYNTDLFHEATICRFSHNFNTLLEEIVKAPNRQIAHLNILSEDEKQKTVYAWNLTQQTYLKGSTIHSLFEKQTEQDGDKTAIIFEGIELTYGQLNRKANILARCLKQKGVKEGDYVGICLERSTDMVVAMLGTLKSGAAYIPLDPTYPYERLVYMIHDAGVSTILGHASAKEMFQELETHVIDIGKDVNFSPGVQIVNMNIPLSSESIAYMIYTSGSTGRPKGVKVPHRAVVNFLQSMKKRPGISKSDKLLAVTTISFDISVLELFLPLIKGASVEMCDSQIATDGIALARIIEDHNITVMQATPSTWKLLIEAGWKGSGSLKILCGGEPLSTQLARELISRSESLWNMYGPTETTVWSSVSEVTDPESINIGRPINNTFVYILDAYLQPVPLSVPGTLYIGGDGLSYGYHNQPDLTRKKFIHTNIYGNEVKLYNTGDLVRWRGDGVLEYIARVDKQVKLRGFRIELEEISAVLSQHKSVTDSMTLVNGNENNKKLVAYYISKDNHQMPVSELKAFLRQKLPEYMVPAIFTQIDEWPLLPNGKTDTNRLPEPEMVRNQDEIVYARDIVEHKLVSMWEEILNVSPIGVNDNFFDLGGHSLLGVNLMNAIEQAFDKKFPASVLFQKPSIEELAEVIRQGGSIQETPLVWLQSKGAAEPVFCPHPIGGNVFCYTQMTKHFNDRPIIGIQSPALYSGDIPEVRVDDMAKAYIQAIQEVKPHGPYHFVAWCFGGLLAFEMAQQLYNKGEETASLTLLDTRAPFLDPEEKYDDADLLSWFARDLAVPFGKTLSLPPEELRKVGVDNMFNYVLDKAITSNVLSKDADYEQLFQYFQVYIANGIALQEYELRPYPGKVTLLKAKEEPLIDSLGSNLGWDRCELGDLEVIDIPGNHNTLLYEPNIRKVAEIVKSLVSNKLKREINVV